MKPIHFSLVLSGLLVLTALSAYAVQETDVNVVGDTAAGGTYYDGNIQANDLLQGVTPVAVFTTTTTSYTAGQTITGGDGNTPLSGLNDGGADDSYGNSSSQSLWFGANGQLGVELLAEPQLTYTLNTSVNTNGYDLTSINSIFGYGGTYSSSFANQYYTISYSTVAAPTTFIPFYTVNYSPFADTAAYGGVGANDGTPAESQVTLTDLNLTGVAALQFTFLPSTNGTGYQVGQWIREIDVDGTASTAVVPEPSAYAMSALGLLALFALGRWRRRLA